MALKRMNHSARGFTLFEMLVVMGIIVLVFSVGFGIRVMRSQSNVDTCVRVVQSLLQKSHVTALSRGRAVRFLVQKDFLFPGQYLRYIILVVEGDHGWSLVGRPALLPQGWYIVPPKDLPGVWEGACYSTFSGNGETMRLNPDGRGFCDYLFLEFQSDGNVAFLTETDYLKEDIGCEAFNAVLLTVSGFEVGQESVPVQLSADSIIGTLSMQNGEVVCAIQ